MSGFCINGQNKPADTETPAHLISLTPSPSPLIVKACLCVLHHRKVHLHWGPIPSGEADGLLPHSDVHPQSSDCHFVMGVLLDQHGRCARSSGPWHHHGADHDHAEFWFPRLLAQGESETNTAPSGWRAGMAWCGESKVVEGGTGELWTEGLLCWLR